MLYLTCTMISSVDLAHYGVSLAKDWVSVDCGTICHNCKPMFFFADISVGDWSSAGSGGQRKRPCERTRGS